MKMTLFGTYKAACIAWRAQHRIKFKQNSERSCLSNTYACGNLRSSCAVVPGMDTCHIHPLWCMNTPLVQDCYYSSIIISLLQKRCRTFKSTCFSNWNREGNSTQTAMNDRKIRLCLLSCRCQDLSRPFRLSDHPRVSFQHYHVNKHSTSLALSAEKKIFLVLAWTFSTRIQVYSHA
jgi:hypothetical protein